MVIRDRYHDEGEVVALGPPASDHSNDEPPSYETISTACASGQPNGGPTTPPVPKQLTSQPSPATRSNTPSGVGVSSTSCPVGRPSQSNLSSRHFASSFPSSSTSKQVRQTILILVRNLVLNAGSPNLLDSCVNACRTYHLNLSVLLQERFIDNHSAIYWAILKGRDALVPMMLVHADSLSGSTKSEIYRACLATANQNLFHSLRCYRASSRRGAIPLVSTSATDMLMLGSTPSDEVSIHEIGSQGAFVAKIRVSLWQRRMRAGGVIPIDFIARGRIWRLESFTPLSSNVIGQWRVGVCLLEHSPPTFVDSILLIDLPPVSDSLPSRASDLISLSPSSDDPSSAAALPPLPTSSYESEPESKAPQTIEIYLNSQHRLAYSSSNHVEQWTDKDGSTYTNAILVSLDDGAGAELLYENTPFVASDGTLHLRFEARLEKPEAEGAAC